jgi:hypothetical protein
MHLRLHMHHPGCRLSISNRGQQLPCRPPYQRHRWACNRVRGRGQWPGAVEGAAALVGVNVERPTGLWPTLRDLAAGGMSGRHQDAFTQ